MCMPFLAIIFKSFSWLGGSFKFSAGSSEKSEEALLPTPVIEIN